MTPAELERFSRIVETRYGLRVDERVASSPVVVERSHGDATAYLDRLDRGEASELRALITAITVGETYFFRHAEQYQAFADVAVTERMAARASARRLSVLSAGCSTGEEPYTLAMILRDRAIGWQLDVHGVDANPESLARAAKGRYGPWAMRAMPADYHRRWFRPVGKDFVLAPEIRATVKLTEASVVDDGELWEPGRWDVIFCRNVVMYFTEAKLDAFVHRLATALAPGGYLFLGHAETLRARTDELELCHTHGTFYYRRGGPSLLTTALPSHWIEDIEAATRRVQALVAEVPLVPVASPPRVIDDLATIRALIGDDRFDDALARLDALTPSSPRADALLLRAVVLTHRGSLGLAEEVCKSLLELEPGHAGGHYLLALGRETTGDLVGAVFHAGRASELDP
ncbi:MAG TPA: CheR family methyltransferase, partial [Kofleriaceae bacterium]|nr:CheR family methyltransferase [Kofleriaceae bacterium]